MLHCWGKGGGNAARLCRVHGRHAAPAPLHLAVGSVHVPGTRGLGSSHSLTGRAPQGTTRYASAAIPRPGAAAAWRLWTFSGPPTSCLSYAPTWSGLHRCGAGAAGCGGNHPTLTAAPQFNSVVAQENENDANMALPWGAVERMVRLGVGSYVVLSQIRKYGCLVYLGHVDGFPVLTFTCPPGAIDADLSPPSDAYASVLVRGLVGGGMCEADARGYVGSHTRRTAQPNAPDPDSRPRLPHALPAAVPEGAQAERLSSVGPAARYAGPWADGPVVVAAQAPTCVHAVVGARGAQSPATPTPPAAARCLVIRCRRAPPVDRDLSLRRLLPCITAQLVSLDGAQEAVTGADDLATPSLLATGDAEADAAPAAVVHALAATLEHDMRLRDYQLAADPGAAAWRVCFARYWRELPPAPPTCISCDPEAVVGAVAPSAAAAGGEDGAAARPVVCAKDLGLPQHSNPLAHAWLDAQKRPMLVVTPQRHVESLTELNEQEAEALWAVVDSLLREGGDAETGNWRAHINAGRYRNLRHLHVKLSPPPTVFDRIWGSHPGLQRAMRGRVTASVVPGR